MFSNEIWLRSPHWCSTWTLFPILFPNTEGFYKQTRAESYHGPSFAALALSWHERPSPYSRATSRVGHVTYWPHAGKSSVRVQRSTLSNINSAMLDVFTSACAVTLCVVPAASLTSAEGAIQTTKGLTDVFHRAGRKALGLIASSMSFVQVLCCAVIWAGLRCLSFMETHTPAPLLLLELILQFSLTKVKPSRSTAELWSVSVSRANQTGLMAVTEVLHTGTLSAFFCILWMMDESGCLKTCHASLFWLFCRFFSIIDGRDGEVYL